ncbi:MAG: hypothetical protein ABSF69_15940 [Polyangiaceae bacterium]|jgi:hypothetical protein
MTRSLLIGLMAIVALMVLSGTGCQSTGVGDPCTPGQEYTQSFLGFDEGEVSVEALSFQCQTRLCLVNHFQGRVSCPYGQNANGTAIAGTLATPECNQGGGSGGACCAGINVPVTGTADGLGGPMSVSPTPSAGDTYVNSDEMATVPPQCSSRLAADAVYCSCRCANVNGLTNDGYNYCTCPTGFECTQLVSSIGGNANQGLTGAYCIKSGSAYNPAVPCSACDPSSATTYCGTTLLQGATEK